MSKDDFPPLLIVSGSQTLLRTRFLKTVLDTQTVAGWKVEEVEGADASAVRDILEGGGMFSTQRVLAVVANPEKIDLDLLNRHSSEKNAPTTLLLHIEGEPDGRTKFGKWVKKMAAIHKGFPKPSQWDQPKVAAQFAVDESKLYGLHLDARLSRALVGRVESDLGVLSFEIQKAAILAISDGSKEITSKHIKGAMAPIAEASVAPIVDALAVRNRKRLVKALAHFDQTTKGDQTIRICRFVGSSVLKWVAAVHLESLPPKAAADQLGVHPWYFETKILPPARRWGKTGTVRLASDLAAAERAVLNGAVSPWVVLTSRLLAAC